MFSVALKVFVLLLSFWNVLGETVQDSIYHKFQQNDYKLKFERLQLVSFDKHIMKAAEIVTFKYNRTCAVCNATFEFKLDMGNDLEVVIQAYKFASNEYRLFPLRLQVNACLALKNDLMGVGKFLKNGNFTGCPLQKRKLIRVYNWSPDESRFPPHLPNGKYMIELQFLYHNAEFAVVNAYGEAYRPI